MKTNKIRVTILNGNRVVKLNQNNLDECIRFINEENISYVKIDDDIDQYSDLNFLNECNNIKYLSFANHFINDISAIKNLKLEILALHDTKAPINIGELKNLKTLYITWYKKIEGLGEVDNLNELNIWSYAPKSRDIDEIAKLKNLRFLSITQSKIDSLNGIANLNQLKSLQLNYLRTLTQINEIESVTSLEKLEIESCKNIEDFSKIKRLNYLYELNLFKCGEIESINFINELSNLKNFAFYETNVKDGDISPCMNIKNVWFDNKKHYSHKNTEFNNVFD